DLAGRGIDHRADEALHAEEEAVARRIDRIERGVAAVGKEIELRLRIDPADVEGFERASRYPHDAGRREHLVGPYRAGGEREHKAQGQGACPGNVSRSMGGHDFFLLRVAWFV